MAAPKPPTPLEVALAEAQNLVNLWLKTRTFFAKANTEDPITREEEQAFLESKSEISRFQRILAPKLPPDASFGGERMIDLLRASISIGHLRGLPKPDRLVLMANWHAVFVYLSRTIGALQFMVEGYVPPPRAHKAAGGNISELKAAAGQGAKKKEKKSPINAKVIVVIILLAVAGYVVFSRLK